MVPAVSYRLQASPLMVLLFVLFFGVFSALSLWQVMRVYEKQAIAEQIDWASRQSDIDLATSIAEGLLDYEFYSARARGRFVVERCFYVENVIRAGKPGLYLYCPLEIAGRERLLLVNMGWIGRPRDRFDLPPIEVADGAMAIEGIIRQPRSKPVVVAEGSEPNIEMDHLWAYFDFDYLQATLTRPLLPVELQLTSDITPRMLREWSGYDPKIGMHIGYAIHWGAFALVTLGLFIRFNVKKKDVSDDGRS